ncbi:MAG: S-layer family protein, partial [Proteobacteria bacterium]|nr:S-layer family protein [Pseudomonadota bacterium]
TVAFGNTVNAATVGQQALTVSANATFANTVGVTTALRELSVGGTTGLNGTAVATSNAGGGSGNQTYTGAVTLGSANGTTVALANTGGTVAFGNTVNAATVGQQALTVSANATFANTVGATTALRALSVGGTTGINTTAIATTNAGGGTGNQTYTGAVTLGTANGSTVTLTDTGGTVAFGGTLDGATAGQQALSVSDSATFGGTVGGVAGLSSINVGGTTTLATTTITTTNVAGGTGGQTYTGPVILGTPNGTTVTLTFTGGTVTFSKTVDATTAGQQSMAVSDNAVFQGVVGGATALGSLSVGGTTSISTTSIVTTNAGGGTGSQTYTGAVTLSTGNGTTVALTNTGGTAAFGNTVNAATVGQQALTVSNNATFANTVGATTALRGLSVGGTSGINTTSIATTNAGGGSGSQTYTGAVTLGGTGNGTTVALANTGGTVAFGSTVNAATVGQQALTVSNNATFANTVGVTTALRALSVGGTAGINTAAIATTNAGGGTGNQTYTGAVTVGGTGNGSTVTLTDTGGTVAFASTLDGATAGQQALGISNNATFGAVVGGATALRGLSVGGTAGINTTAITTTNTGGGSGNQIYTGAVTLGTSTTVNSGTGNVTFSGTVDGTTSGGQALTVNSAGTTLFSSAVGGVGGTTALASLTTDASGTSSLRNVTTSGAQTYNDDVTLNGAYTTTNTGVGTSAFIAAKTTTLAGDTTVSTGLGNVTFTGTVNAAASGVQGLTVNSSGATLFSSAVGGGTNGALKSLTTDANTAASVNGTVSLQSVTTTGAQNYNENATLIGTYTTSNSPFNVGGTATFAGPTSIVTGGGDATFGGAIDGATTFQVDTNRLGNVTFNSTIGANSRPTLLTVSGTRILAHDATTNGAQLWDGNVTFNSTETTNGGNFTVTGTTTVGNLGNGALVISTGAGDATLQGAVNATTSGGQSLTVN